MDDELPPPHVAGPLATYWSKPVRDLVALPVVEFEPADRERHRIFSLLAMALVYRYWNGNKRGPDGEYLWRPQQRLLDGRYSGGDYIGHNIACLGVDGAGRPLDFDFNHNEIFSSSVEHAESRLVRRIFSLVQLRHDWRPPDRLGPERVPARQYSTTLEDVTIYSTLEPCAQCAGIMALGRVRRVVYVQGDPGMYLICNILRNLTQPTLRAPLPIRAAEFGLEYAGRLDESYVTFTRDVGNRAFHVSLDGVEDRSPSLTSFLCTDDALAIFREAHSELASYRARFPTYRPPDAVPPEKGVEILDNEGVRREALRFLEYAVEKAQRGTPHQL